MTPFVSSGEVLRIISIQQVLKSGVLPSEIMGIDDEYTAFCFNEACSYIVSRLQDGDEPIFKEISSSEISNKVYSKPSDFYKKFD